MLKASVVIPTYYRTFELSRLLKCILHQHVLPTEVIVVDDTQTSEVKDLCDEFFQDFVKTDIQFRYIGKPKNERSIARSRNLGALAAKGDVVMFLDSDTIPYPDYIKNILIQFEKYPQVLGVGAWFLPSRNALLRAQGLRYYVRVTFNRIFALEKDSRNSCRNFEYPIVLTRTINCEWLLGASMSFKKGVFREFLFDENLGTYSWGEDFLFSNLVNKAYPNTLLLTPDARIIHAHGGEARMQGKEFFDMRVRNSKYELEKLWSFIGLFIFSREILGLQLLEIIKWIKMLMSVN